MLLSGVILVLAAFASTFETELWGANDSLLLPLLAVGVSLVILNIFLRIIRPKLRVTLFEIQGDLLKIRPVKNLQFSGWVAKSPVTANVADIASVEAHDFYSHGTHAGMYWICLELSNGRVIELNTDNEGLVKEVVRFFRSVVPDVDITVDAKITD